MRLRGISDIEAANRYTEEFMENHNKKFGKKASCRNDLHRKTVPKEEVLDAILSERYYRNISKNLEFSFDNKVYQVAVEEKYLGSSKVTLCRFISGEMKIWYKNNFVNCNEFKQRKKATVIATGKELNETIDKLCPEAISKEIGEARAWENVAFLRTIDRE